MKNRKKKLAALLLGLLLLFQPVSMPAEAKEVVYFTAVNDNVLALSDETMPFWSGGYLYIAGSIFTGFVRENTGVSYTYNASKQLAALYTDGRSLIFDLAKNYVQDKQGESYYPTAIQRGGVVFVPASLVAEYFGLSYSVAAVDHGYLVWLREPDSVLSMATFADAASSTMRERYNTYRKSREEEQQTAAAPEEPQETFEGKSIYLCFQASEPLVVTNLLDALDRQESQAAFFCTLEFLEGQGDLLRRMAATGHAIGLLADCSDPERSAALQLERGNEALYQATCGKSRLVYLQNADSQTIAETEQAGFVCLSPTMDGTNQGLRSSVSAASLLQKISSRRGDVSVWLGGNVNAAGLRAFITAARQAEDRCLALVETVV